MKKIRPILGIALFMLLSLCATVSKAESAFERPDSLNRVRIQQASTGVELRQNFPNPFNQSTRIVFTAPNEQNVELKVYDILGQVVFQRFISADRGINTVSFDRGKPESGNLFLFATDRIYRYYKTNEYQRLSLSFAEISPYFRNYP